MYSNTEPENLQYLNVDQALADIAYFIEIKKRELGRSEADVIVFGGSYAGNMAAWARLKYPHLIQGALASSAPVHAKCDFFGKLLLNKLLFYYYINFCIELCYFYALEYYDVVTNSLSRYNKQCVVDIKTAIDTVEALLSTEDGPKQLKKDFK